MRAYLSPVVVAGGAVSVGLALLLRVAGAASAAQALLVGLSGTTLVAVLDATVRAERRFRLRALTETTDWLAYAVRSVATATRRIVAEHGAPELVGEARRRLRTLAEDFDDLAEGRLVRPAADYEVLMSATDACHRRLAAVTTVGPGAAGTRWWDSEVGRRFWQANLDALARGVAVTRVFVCAGMDADVAELVAAQRAAGVETLVARAPAGQPAVELVLWEGHRGWRARVDAEGRVVDHLFTVNERDIQRLREAFERWRRAAEPVDD